MVSLLLQGVEDISHDAALLKCREVKMSIQKANLLFQRLQKALQMGSLLGTQGDKGHDQHGGSASGDQAPQHQNLSHCAFAAAGWSAVHQVAAAEHSWLHQTLRLPCSRQLSHDVCHHHLSMTRAKHSRLPAQSVRLLEAAEAGVQSGDELRKPSSASPAYEALGKLDSAHNLQSGVGHATSMPLPASRTGHA